jgi:hydroxymethylbilane synthase
MSLRIGTRRSALALAQAGAVVDMLGTHGVAAELVPMSTSGDEGDPEALAAQAANDPRGMKGLWVDRILDALDAGEIDVAVHSAKDLPADDDDGFTIAAVPVRADPFDLLVCGTDDPLEPGARIGTSSLRRRALLLASFPSFEVVDLRGNVDTRLRKVADGEVDAAVLAAAGLERLGVEAPYARHLPLEVMVPAPGQGCLALQTRNDDDQVISSVGQLDDPASRRALSTERSIVWRLGGGCALPLGAFAEVEGDAITCTAVIAEPGGDRIIRVEHGGSSPEDVAGAVTRDLIAQGAEEILEEVRRA